jgi:3-methylcrotonyl-CoA carboxylase alpha subunit
MPSGWVADMDFQSHPKMGTVLYQLGDEVKTVQLARHGDKAQVSVGDRVYDVDVIHSRAGELTFSVDGVTHTALVAHDGSTHYVAIDGDVVELKKPDLRRARRKQHLGEDNLTASMPGQVTKVLISEGDRVQRGQPLIVLEAMKMEIKIAAPHDGRVAKVLVQQGQVVDRGQVLIEMTNDQ